MRVRTVKEKRDQRRNAYEQKEGKNKNVKMEGVKNMA
jgi:hypothetical protein